MAKLHWLTEDNLPEIYLVLASWRDSHGNTWVKIRVPKRPNGVTGWVPRRALRQYTPVSTFLDLNRSSLVLTLYRAGKVVMSAHVGIGSGANPTPRGHFYVREKFRVKGSPVYGPFALGTSAYAPHLTDWPGGGVVGLHGTNEPGLIPGRPSHGCIRLRNEKITRLYRLVPRGHADPHPRLRRLRRCGIARRSSPGRARDASELVVRSPDEPKRTPSPVTFGGRQRASGDQRYSPAGWRAT